MAGTRSKADGRDNGGGGGFVCTHCGSCLSNLHEKISGADLILHHPCEECGMVADAYSEFSVTLVLIDVVLLREAAMVHLLYNRFRLASPEAGRISLSGFVAMVALTVAASFADSFSSDIHATLPAFNPTNAQSGVQGPVLDWSATASRGRAAVISFARLLVVCAAATVALVALGRVDTAQGGLCGRAWEAAVLSLSATWCLLLLVLCAVWDYTQSSVLVPWWDPWTGTTAVPLLLRATCVPKLFALLFLYRHAVFLRCRFPSVVVFAAIAAWAVTKTALP